MYTTITILLAIANLGIAKYCGVVTSPIQSYVACESEQFPPMDEACTSVGGHVAGHNREHGDARSNCIVYCNGVPTGGHDRTQTINPRSSYHLYVVDECGDCDYCGPPS